MEQLITEWRLANSTITSISCYAISSFLAFFMLKRRFDQIPFRKEVWLLILLFLMAATANLARVLSLFFNIVWIELIVTTCVAIFSLVVALVMFPAVMKAIRMKMPKDYEDLIQHQHSLLNDLKKENTALQRRV